MSLMFDYVTMPPKSQEISQIQNLEHTKNEQAQQEIASQFQEGVKHNSEQTVRRKKVENEEFKFREKKEQQREKKNQNNKKKETKEEKNNKIKLVEGGNFDIKI